MDHAPFHGNIKIEIPGPPLQYHATTPHQHDATTPSVQYSTVLIKHNNLYSLMPHLLTVLGIPIQRGPAAIIASLFGKKWPTQDTTEGGMAKQPWELDPAHHATRAGS